MPLHLSNQLKRAIQNDPSGCVLLVGAGLSTYGVRKGGKGLPDWDTLIQHMIEDLRDSKRCEADTLSKLEQLLKEEKYLEIAGKFKGKTRPDQFAAFLKAELDPPDLAPSEIHEVILKTNFRGIITTNFDCVFEYQDEYHNKRLQPLVYPDCLSKIYRFKELGFFAKMHGCIHLTPIENLVLTKESYAALSTDGRYGTLLKALFVLNTILTVGFSLRDPDFLGLVDDLREILKESMPTIYALTLEPGQRVRDEWRSKGIEIIPYENHEELLPFFKEMLQVSEQTRPLTKITPQKLEREMVSVGLEPKAQNHGVGRPPPGPDFFYGTLSLNGTLTPAGITVTARVNGIVCGSITTQAGGIYGTSQRPLLVQSNKNITIKNGDKIEFYANLSKCKETATFVEWRNPPMQFNLTASTVPLPITPPLESSIHMAKTIAFLSIDRLVARAAIEAKKAELEAGGARTVIIDYFAQDTADFTPYLTKIKYVNPDLLIICLPGGVEQIIQKQIMELGGWGAITVLPLAYMTPTSMPTPTPIVIPPPKPASWQELPKNLKDIYNINYYFPGKWITMTTLPLPTIILALDPTFFPNTDLREYDVPAGTTKAQYRDIIINKYPSEKGGEYDGFTVLEQGDITLDDGTQTVYLIYKGIRMGYGAQAFAVVMVRGTQGFILSGGDYPVTFSDNQALLTQIVKTLHFTVPLPPPAPQNWNEVKRKR